MSTNLCYKNYDFYLVFNCHFIFMNTGSKYLWECSRTKTIFIFFFCFPTVGSTGPYVKYFHFSVFFTSDRKYFVRAKWLEWKDFEISSNFGKTIMLKTLNKVNIDLRYRNAHNNKLFYQIGDVLLIVVECSLTLLIIPTMNYKIIWPNNLWNSVMYNS